jgi:phosphoribosylaminoimidazole carboxylase PurE protein
VIIAGAGGAAHLPGMIAAHTRLPVLGVPVESRVLRGVDSLLSIVQMPAGIPVATLAIGTAGAKNAALLAVSILALHDDAARAALEKFAASRRSRFSPRSCHDGSARLSAGQHHRSHGRWSARADVCHRGTPDGLSRAHLFTR